MQKAERLRLINLDHQHRAMCIQILSPLAEILRNGRRGFSDVIAERMEQGYPPYGKGAVWVCDMLARKGAKYGTLEYDILYSKFQEIFEETA